MRQPYAVPVIEISPNAPELSSLGYFLRPRYGAEAALLLKDEIFSSHLHLMGDSFFHEDAIRDLVEQQISRGMGALVLYPQSATGFLSRVTAAAARAGRAQDVIVLDFLEGASTHRYVPAGYDQLGQAVPSSLRWLTSRVSSFVPPPCIAYASAAFLQHRKSLDEAQTLGRAVSLLEKAHGHPEMEPRERDLCLDVLCRLERVRHSGRLRYSKHPKWRPFEQDLRGQIVCVPVPDVLARKPAEPMRLDTQSDIAAALATCVLLDVVNAARTGAVRARSNSLMLLVPELFRLTPQHAGAMLRYAPFAKAAFVQYSRNPLGPETTQDARSWMMGHARAHVGRSMDENGQLLLVYIDMASPLGVLMPECCP